MSECFLKLKSLGENLKKKLDFSNYATKADFKKIQQVLIHRILLKKADLANSKSDENKLDIDKLKNLPSNLSNLKSKTDKLYFDKVVPVAADFSTKLCSKKQCCLKDVYNAKIKDIEDIIPDIIFAINTNLKAKINEVKNKIPNIN